MKTLKNTLVLTSLFAITFSFVGCTNKCDNNGLRDRLCLNNFLSQNVAQQYTFYPPIPPGDFKQRDPKECTDFLAAAGIVSSTNDFLAVTDQVGVAIFDGDVIGGVISRGPEVFQTYATKTVGADNASIEIRVNDLENKYPITPYCAAGNMNGVSKTPLSANELYETLRIGSLTSTSLASVYRVLIFWSLNGLHIYADGGLTGMGSGLFRYASFNKVPSIP